MAGTEINKEPDNPYERLARLEKAAKIAIYIAGVRPETVQSEEDWMFVAYAAGVRKPSLKTRKEVLRLISEVFREEDGSNDAVGNPPSDQELPPASGTDNTAP